MQTKCDRNVSPDEVAVGDLDSDAIGSGARKNAGKIQLDLVPVVYWEALWSGDLEAAMEYGAYEALTELGRWQRGNTHALAQFLSVQDAEDMEDMVKVLEFGAKKYKAWNWAKGMAWSVPTGCILRHIKKILEGELVDDDSGLPHYAHVLCNIMMLAYYAEHYTAGDDRPPRAV